MKTKNKKAKEMDLEDLLINKLFALYYIENTMIKSLPKLMKASTDVDLKNGFREHLEETKTQAGRLEEIFAILDITPKKLKSEAMDGLVADGEWIIKNVNPEEAKDANLARAAQMVEHYEISAYMAAISWAEELDLEEISSLLQETLEEEKTTDEKLDEIGSKIQKGIASSDDEDEDDE